MRGVTVLLICVDLLGLMTKGEEVSFKKEEIYKGPPDFIKIPTGDLDKLFKAMDKNGDGKLDSGDLGALFTNPHAAGDADKFLDEADLNRADKEVDHDEFFLFMSEQSAVWAVAGCKFVKESAQTLKLRCYLDEFMAYVHGLMPFEEVKEVFQQLDQNGNGEITADELTSRLKIEGEKGFDQEKLHDVVSNLFEEWGENKQKTTFPEFKSYVRQGDVYREMKPCQHKASCSKDILIKYSTYTVTEHDIFNLFKRLDKTHDGKLKKDDLLEHTMNPNAFLDLVHINGDDGASFEEFRMFMKRVLIRNVLEEYCALIFNASKQQDCYLEHLFGILRFAYRYAKLSIPHTDVLYTFEELDRNNNGGITDEDLLHYETNSELRKRVLELDTSSKGENINVEEMAFFLSYPCTIYALSGCLFESADKRSGCFARSFVDFASHVMSDKEIEEFFRLYDPMKTQKISKENIDSIIPQGLTHDEDVENFINELGLGDDEVTLFEFSSYVRHPDLQKAFERCGTVLDKQTALLEYIQKRLTEYDIEQVFEKFDVNKDLEIDMNDLKSRGKSDDDRQKFLKAMDCTDEGSNIDFKEFRFYLLQQDNKVILENECTAPLTTQKEEMACYQEKIWTMATK